MTDQTAEQLANDLNCTLDRITDALRGDDADSLPVADAIQHGLKQLAAAITPPAAGGHDASGGYVSSLSEAVMGMTAGLCKIAAALDNVAEAIRERQ